MKISIVLLSLFCFSVSLFSVEEYYRSNSNGLLLLQIEAIDRHEYEYVIQRDFNEMEQETTRTLWKKNVAEKKWDYSYAEGDLSSERYYQNGELKEEYNYDRNGHKILQTEYRNGEVSKKTKYIYNKDGLVEQEEIDDIYLDRKNKITYRYDSTFRIKQIIREMDDGTIVYWDAFFSKKGIVAKEYYTIGNENYIFYYGANGEELKGEVIERVEDDSPEENGDNSDTTTDTVDNADGADKKVAKKKMKEQRKLYWENKYSRNGIKIYKEETNYKLNKTSKIWYDNSGRAIKTEIYNGDDLEKIEEQSFSEDGQIICLKQIV
ncbi:MAG: hypothetical protein II220_06815, partial [Spirochaetales bacterium]|nr:hypothetical protein [Spirochaetales bacterium]